MKNKSRLALLGATVAGLAGMGLSLGGMLDVGVRTKPKSKDVIRSSVPQEEQDRRIAAAQAKRERKNAARLKQSGGAHA